MEPDYCAICGRDARKLDVIKTERVAGQTFVKIGCNWCEGVFWYGETYEDWDAERKARGLER